MRHGSGGFAVQHAVHVVIIPVRKFAPQPLQLRAGPLPVFLPRRPAGARDAPDPLQDGVGLGAARCHLVHPLVPLRGRRELGEDGVQGLVLVPDARAGDGQAGPLVLGVRVLAAGDEDLVSVGVALREQLRRARRHEADGVVTADPVVADIANKKGARLDNLPRA